MMHYFVLSVYSIIFHLCFIFLSFSRKLFAFQVVFPIQHVKGNFPHLQAALAELRTHPCIAYSGPDSDSVLEDGIREAIEMFRRQAQNLLQVDYLYN